VARGSASRWPYNERHNEANGENGRDGSENNRSWNCGIEGETQDPEVNALRERQMRNMLATLLLSQGTPMLLAGDEFARTQRGNNNAYCQDNDISWVDWTPNALGERLTAFVRQLTRLRANYPILRRSRFLSGEMNEDLGVREVTWINANGEQMQQAHWQDEGMRCFGMMLDGRAQPTGIRQRGSDATMLLVFNAHHDVVHFTLPRSSETAVRWRLLIDTYLSDPQPAPSEPASGESWEVTARSFLLFEMRPHGA